MGERAGKKLRKVGSGFGYYGESPVFKGDRCTSINGFTLHANVSIEGSKRKSLEKLCRYILRPSLSNERITLDEQGNINYELKRVFSDGTTHYKFSPLELLEKLAALVPVPKANLIRYSGCFAPNSSIRKKVVLKISSKRSDSKDNDTETHDSANRPYRIAWGRLLKRVFDIDITICKHCKKEMKIIAVILRRDVIVKILTHLKINSDLPKKLPSKLAYSFP